MSNSLDLSRTAAIEPAPSPIRRPRGIGFALSKYIAIFNTRISHCLAYTGEILTRTFFLGSILYIFVRLWSTTYRGMGTNLIEGFSMHQMIWYLVVTEAITMSRATFTGIDDDVKSGSIAYALNRPYHYVLYLFADSLGDRMFKFIMNLLVGSAIALALVGPIHITFEGCLVAFIAVLFSQVLDLLGTIIIGLFAFWIEDTRSIALLHSRLTMLLGGLLMPIDVFPRILAHICKYLPFVSILYLPAHTFVAGVNNETIWLMLRQSGWILIFATMAVMIYNRGVRRVESNGG